MNSNSERLITLMAIAALASSAGLGCQSQHEETSHHHHDDHGDESEHDEARGPHGGKVLRGDDGFSLEVTIYEPGIPPQSRVYAYLDEKLLDPATVTLTIELHRFDRVDKIAYSKQADFLFGDKVVEEPHSFDVKVYATHAEKKYSWEYQSYEGRVEISEASARLSGVRTETAEPRRLVKRVPVLGQVGFNQDAVKHVGVRYAGVVRSLAKRVGDYVRKGETLAVVLGTDSLNEYTVHAPGSGRVVEKRATAGEVVGAGAPLYVVADLSTVWIDFTVYRRDALHIASGQRVSIIPGDGMDQLEGTLAYLAPVGDSPSQSVTARAVVRNKKGQLRPGLFVKGEIDVGFIDAEVAVLRDAVQTFRDWQVVFRNRGTLYEIAVVELGVADGDYVQVLSGLVPGASYVAYNSFIVKADIGKAGASHDH